MVKRVLLAYLAVELLAVAVLAWALGPWWTVAIVIGTVLLGPLLVGSQLRKQFAVLRSARAPRTAADGLDAVTDGLLMGLGTTLVLVPGPVSTVVGGLMLAPPSRGVMRPLAQVMLSRGISKRLGPVDLSTRVGGQVIDGEVIEGEVIEGDRVAPVPNLPAVR